MIGGGVSGLTVAGRLASDCQVIVLEARSRVGGRVHTVNEWGERDGTGGNVIDLGASFVHGCFDENPVFRMSKVAGCELKPGLIVDW